MAKESDCLIFMRKTRFIFSAIEMGPKITAPHSSPLRDAGSFAVDEDFLAPLVVHHRFISFTLYCACIVAFVLSLKRKQYLKQFTL
ncbi:hypothetical protein ACTXT7_016786, partial [Hymenolepis weldensis]